MRALRLFLAAVFLLVGAGCLKAQGENQGAQTPSERARPPKERHLRTDGPTNPRSSAARPPEPEKRKKSSQD